MYVIRRTSDGKFVAIHGSINDYLKNVHNLELEL